LLEIRPPKTTGVTVEDTESDNCLGKVNFTSAERCAGTWAQQAHRAPHRSVFLSLMQWDPAHPLLALMSSSAQDWLMLYLEFEGVADSNFSSKTELSEQEPGTGSS
jgi:hypothetical protein